MALLKFAVVLLFLKTEFCLQCSAVLSNGGLDSRQSNKHHQHNKHGRSAFG